MSYQSIFEELQQLRNHLYGDFLIAEKKRIVELYHIILHKQVKNLNCGDCYRDAFIELYTYVKQHLTEVLSDYPFVLKEGEVIHFFGESEYYSNEVPEQVARKYLQTFPNAISKFSQYPDDWQKQESENKATKLQEIDTAPTKRGRGRPPKNK